MAFNEGEFFGRPYHFSVVFAWSGSQGHYYYDASGKEIPAQLHKRIQLLRKLDRLLVGDLWVFKVRGPTCQLLLFRRHGSWTGPNTDPLVIRACFWQQSPRRAN